MSVIFEGTNMPKACCTIDGEHSSFAHFEYCKFYNICKQRETIKTDFRPNNCPVKPINQEMITDNDLKVDCISRKEVEKLVYRFLREGTDENIAFYEHFLDLPSVTTQEPKWIPVSERLPNWNTQCLVIDEHGACGVGYYRKDARAWDSPNWGWIERKDRVDNKEAFTEPCGIGKVVAWMPLPLPYEPQESEVEE